MNQSPYDGQWRQAAWLLVARGARHDRVLALAHPALRRRDLLGRRAAAQREPGRAYREIARIGDELGRVGDAFADADPRLRRRGALRLRQQVRAVDPGPVARRRRPDAWSTPTPTGTIVAAFSRGIFDAKRQQRLVRREQLRRRGARALPRARRPRPLHGIRRRPRPPRRLRPGRGPPRARAPHRLRRPRGAGPRRARAGPPGRAPPGPGSRRRRRWRSPSRSPEACSRRRHDPRRGSRARRRRGAGDVHPPAPGAVGRRRPPGRSATGGSRSSGPCPTRSSRPTSSAGWPRRPSAAGRRTPR